MLNIIELDWQNSKAINKLVEGGKESYDNSQYPYHGLND